VFFNALYDDLDRRWDQYMRLSPAEQANSTFPEPPGGYEIVDAYLRAHGYIEQAGSPEEAHNRYELEVDVAFENLQRLGQLGERPEPGTAPGPIKRLFAHEKADLKNKLEAMVITSVFDQRRTSTTAFGNLFAAVCRHPEFVPTITEEPKKHTTSG
jgi:hypothetical protein